MKIPNINPKAVCISSDNNSRLARKISSYFAGDAGYFTVFNFPSPAEPKKVIITPEEDGFFSQAIGGNNSTYIVNAISKIQPDFIIFAGLSENQKSYLKINPKHVINVNTVNDIKKYPDLFVTVKEDQITRGEAENLVIVEDSNDLTTVVAENLARCMNAEIITVEKTEKRISNQITNYIYEWKEQNKYSSYIKIENLVKKRVSHINFARYKTATFFTNGIPYGLVLDNPIPFSYVDKTLRPDIFIVNNIIYSKISYGVSICFSIDQFLGAEPEKVSKIYRNNNLRSIELFGNNATSFNLENYTSHLAYDFLHIASHGSSKTTAHHIKQKFKDRMGKMHSIEYYEIPTFARQYLEKEDLVGIYTKMIFKKFDGMQWMSKELEAKKYEKYIYEDMFKNLTIEKRKKGEASETMVKNAIVDSAVIDCCDGPHQGQFHTVGSLSSPVVFNNSCWSWSEMSTYFLSGGARSYIGTLWAIADQVAHPSAINFYENVLTKGMCVADTIWQINRNITTGTVGQKNVFFAWTLPFSQAKSPTPSDFENFVKDSAFTFNGYLEKSITKKEEELRVNSEKVAKFMLWVINKEFKFNMLEAEKEVLTKIPGFDIEKYSYVLTRSSST